jgi:hypothetical protein
MEEGRAMSPEELQDIQDGDVKDFEVLGRAASKISGEGVFAVDVVKAK